MKNTIIFTSLLLFVIAFTACQKEDNHDDDHDHISQPSIQVTQPMEGMTYNSGDTVPVKVTFLDDDELHNYSITVTNKTMSRDVLSLGGHEHGTSHAIDTYVVVTATMHADYAMMTSVSNHNGEEAMDTTEFHVHP